MRKRKLLFTMLALSLGCLSGGSGAMAQNGWESIYSQTQTTSASWTAINSGNADGLTLGASGQTTYYYVTGSYNFGSALNYGVSGLKIQGTVYLYIPDGLTINCVGGHASGATGAGAGIELAAGTPTNTLYIIGSGTVNATGGNAANGGNGDNGENANFLEDNWLRPGAGGKGGNGGGGAGAGIGTRGGEGGTGGAGGSTTQWTSFEDHSGNSGSQGSAGATAGGMGTLYVANGITVNATGGNNTGKTGGNGGAGGGCAFNDEGSAQWDYSICGGAGGGGGGFGGAAANIGTGGPGGGAGGGGGSGNINCGSWGFYYVACYGGKGGTNANNTTASNGNNSSLTSLTGVYKTNTNTDYSDRGWGNTSGGNGGEGTGCGTAASAGTQNTGNLTYTITYNPIITKVNGTNTDPVNVSYSPGSPNIVLPANTEGYNWVLLKYGKSCAPNGTTANTFATATTEYFGGNGDETSRTITPINVYGDLVFQEVATMLIMECSTSGESANNDQEIKEFYDYGYNVTTRLQNRTLYRDDHWNTICLPFAMTKTQIAASPLKGATIMKMNESVTGYYPSGSVNKEGYQVKDYGHPIVLFWFDTVDINGSGTVLEAGKPYLVKWTESYEDPNGIWTDGNYADNGTTRHQLDFPGVMITATDPGSWTGKGTTDGNVTFQGTFSLSANLTKLDASGKMNLVLGANDKLYHPLENDAINVGACRGYFKIPAAAAAAAPQFVMGFDDGETTSIQVVNGSGLTVQGSDTYYNLNGQRLTAPQKGINIVNGKKLFVK